MSSRLTGSAEAVFSKSTIAVPFREILRLKRVVEQAALSCGQTGVLPDQQLPKFLSSALAQSQLFPREIEYFFSSGRSTICSSRKLVALPTNLQAFTGMVVQGWSDIPSAMPTMCQSQDATVDYYYVDTRGSFSPQDKLRSASLYKCSFRGGANRNLLDNLLAPVWHLQAKGLIFLPFARNDMAEVFACLALLTKRILAPDLLFASALLAEQINPFLPQQ